MPAASPLLRPRHRIRRSVGAKQTRIEGQSAGTWWGAQQAALLDGDILQQQISLRPPSDSPRKGAGRSKVGGVQTQGEFALLLGTLSQHLYRTASPSSCAPPSSWRSIPSLQDRCPAVDAAGLLAGGKNSPSAATNCTVKSCPAKQGGSCNCQQSAATEMDGMNGCGGADGLSSPAPASDGALRAPQPEPPSGPPPAAPG